MVMLPARYRGARVRVLDLATAAYWIFVATLTLLFGLSARTTGAAAIYLTLAIVTLEIARWCEGPGSPRRGYAMRSLWTVALVALAWNELPRVMRLLDGGDPWATAMIVRADVALFGGHPTVMAQSLFRPWLDEVMAFMNLSYYVFLALPAFLLLRRRPERALAAASVIAVNYATIFGFFILVPVKGPQFSGAEFPTINASDYGGYFFADLLRSLQSTESVIGAAFPSSHVAGAVACAIAAAWWMPRLGVVLVPLSIGLAASTVYLGYHHAVDPIVGVAWGAAAACGARAWMRARGEEPGAAG